MTEQQQPEAHPQSEIPVEQVPAQGPSTPMLIFGLVTLFVVIAAAAFTLATIANNRASEQVADEPALALIDPEAQSDGVTELEPRPLEEFTLVNQEGEEISLSDFQGQYVLLYFGYTYCPDFCPTTLLDFRDVKQRLGEQADEVEFVMISVDSARDTPEVLDRYLERFDPEFIGLVTEDDAALQRVADEFGVFYQANDSGDSPYYTVDHTASKFLIDPEGRLTTVFAFRTAVEDVVESLRAKLS